MALQFEFPANLTADKFITQLSHEANTRLVSRQYAIKTYYDSFDWRLFTNQMTCEFNRSKATSSLTLINFKKDQVIAATELNEVPSLISQFKPGEFRSALEPLLEMRALLSICTLDYEYYVVNIVNSDEKTVLRLIVEEYELLNNRILLQPIKGYDKIFDRFIDTLAAIPGLIKTDEPVLLEALNLQGRKPNDYSPKLNLKLQPDMRADIAAKTIYRYLLNVIKANEQGSIADTDSEFLHDFRVAVRKTRSGLSQLKGVLPDQISAYYADFFYWLGQITGPTRDLDVYLLNFDGYQNSLPIAIRADLDPLYEFLVAKQQKSQRELAKQLRSAKYLSLLAEWEEYLKQPVPENPPAINAKLPIKQLADRRIWKIYRRVLREGNAINELSPNEALHELRKSCKKLRYLTEFFQNLYPDKLISGLLKNLKGLQEVLGDIQDYSVQEQNLRVFSEEMMHNHTPASTLLAIGVLIQELDIKRHIARDNFAEKFSAFKHTDNHHAFKSLFADKSHRY